MRGGRLNAMRAIGPKTYWPSCAGKIRAVLSRIVSAFAIGSAGNRIGIELTAVKDLTQPRCVHRAVDADHSAKAGEEESVSERDDEVPEYRSDKEETPLTAGASY